jgi:hypothetical protein
VTRIDHNGSQVGGETYVGTARGAMAGARVYIYAIFFGGYFTGTVGTFYYNKVDRIDESGSLVGSEGAIGTGKRGPGGANCGNLGLYFGGWSASGVNTNTNIRIDYNGSQVGSETSGGTPRYLIAGAGSGWGNGAALFFSSAGVRGYVNTLTRIASSGIVVSDSTAAGVGRNENAGGGLITTAIFYAGWNGTGALNSVMRFDIYGTQIGGEGAIGTVRDGLAGAKCGDAAMFYAGFTSTRCNITTRIDINGSQVGSETSLGKVRNLLAGASI